MSLYAPRQQTSRIGSPSRRMFKGGRALGGDSVTVREDMSLTMASVSASSIGYRFNPPAGNLVPTSFAGGTVDRLLIVDPDLIELYPAGGAPFPGLADGSAVVMILRGSGGEEVRAALVWNVNLYVRQYEGAYDALAPYVGQALDLTLIGFKA
jgi:hypothetical protein